MGELRILIPAGIGDAAWAMLKVPSWLRLRGATHADVWVYQERMERARSREFLDLVPFARFAGYWDAKKQPMRREGARLIREAPRRVVFETEEAFDCDTPFDFLLYPNRALEEGLDLARDVDPWLAPTFDYPINPGPALGSGPEFEPPCEGPFALVYWTSEGIYAASHDAERAARWATCYRAALDVLPPRTTFVLTGAGWDEPHQSLMSRALAAMRIPHVNLAGKTPFPRFNAMLREAALFVGLPGGNTILSVYYRKPTVIHWPAGMWTPGFARAWAPPGALGGWYAPVGSWPMEPALFREVVRSVRA